MPRLVHNGIERETIEMLGETITETTTATTTKGAAEIETKLTVSVMIKTHFLLLKMSTLAMTTLAMTPSETTEPTRLLHLQPPLHHPDLTTVTCLPDTKALITTVPTQIATPTAVTT